MVAIVGAAAALTPAPRILLVKTSSLGDVVHNLPVVSDLRRHFPDAEIDWLVEEGFAAIPALHPGVRATIPLAVRRWRKHLLERDTWRQVGELRARLRDPAYDIVLDTQGLVKSAVFARWARGERHGYDAASIREPIAARAYANRLRPVPTRTGMQSAGHCTPWSAIACLPLPPSATRWTLPATMASQPSR
jgi:heptosyltransferase I